MSVSKSTFAEMFLALVEGGANGQVESSKVMSLLWGIAHPETTEEVVDLLMEVREMLTDWTEEQKGCLVLAESIQIHMLCPRWDPDEHTPDSKHFHTVNLTRVGGQKDFDPLQVPSRHDFEQIVLGVAVKYHPPDSEVGNMFPVGGQGFVAAFKQMYGDKEIDREVEQFRSELDELFPSTPRKEEGDDNTPRSD